MKFIWSDRWHEINRKNTWSKYRIDKLCSALHLVFFSHNIWRGDYIIVHVYSLTVDKIAKAVSTEMGGVSGSIPGAGHLFSVCNQPATQGQLSLPSLRGR